MESIATVEQMSWKGMRSTKAMEDSDRPGFFKDFYKKVRATVTQEQIQTFSKLKSDEERVKFLYEQVPAVHDIEIQTFYHGKSERDALDRKEAGNKAFGRKNNFEAIQLYSQAVVKAPVLSEENADPRKMTMYPVCLANRSAALYHNNKNNDYYYSVKDIDEALEHHYPKELKWKLYKRKGRILVSLKRHLEARDSYRQAIKWLDWARVDREKRMEIQREIQKWLSIFDTGKVVRNMGDFEVQLYPEVPALTNGPHPVFPALSSKVEIKYSPTQGRYVVAAEDIKIGDYVCAEKPYAAVLLSEAFGTHCQNCFIITRAPIPCTTCSGVVFCSSDCRDTAYFHKVECAIQNLLQGSGMSINCFLAFRMITQTPFSFFVNNVEKLKQEEEPDSVLRLKAAPAPVTTTTNGDLKNEVEEEKPSTDPNSNVADPNSNENSNSSENKENDVDAQNANKEMPPPLQYDMKNMTEEEKEKAIKEEEEQRRKMLEETAIEEHKEYEKARKRIDEMKRKRLEEQQHKESMFWRVYHLVRHGDDRTVEDFLHRTVMACFMVKSLMKTKYFDEYKASGVGHQNKMSVHQALAGGLLLRFLQVIQFNAHEVSEFCLAKPKTLDGCKNLSLGAAIYPTLAYFNHSCHSAQVRYFSGNSVITRAVRPILKGELIPENYGPCYSTKSKADRKLQLVDRYWFDCQCQACVEDWPLFVNMDESRLKFKCHKCSSPLLVPLDNPNPFYKCRRCGEQTNILGACKNLTNSEKTFKAAQAEMELFELEKAEDLLQENLVQLSSALCPPFKDYHLTQECFMKCTLYKGNHRVKKDLASLPDDPE